MLASIFGKIKRLYRSDFIRNASILMTASALSQFIPILLSPITARIYGPSNYGVLGMYMAISVAFTVFSGLGLYSAILIPKNRENAMLVVKTCVTVTLYFSILALVIVLLFRSQITRLLGFSEIYDWLLLIPITIFFSGIGNALLIFFNRESRYKVISVCRILSATVTVVLSIVIGLIKPGPFGLIFSLIAGQVFSAIYLVIKTPKTDRNVLKPATWNTIRSQIKEHKNFPLYTLPADFLYTITNQIPVFLLGKLTSTPSVIGQYNMSNRMLGLPISFLASSFQEVFRQRASQDYANIGNCRVFYLKTFKTLLFLSILPFLIIIFFGQEIFVVAFGQKWLDAGVYAQILAMTFWFRFIVMPVNFTFYIAGRQREHLILYVIVLILTSVAMYLGKVLIGEVKGILWMYSIAYSLMYLVYLIRSYTLSGGN